MSLVDNGAGASFATAGERHRLWSLLTVELDPWQDYAFGWSKESLSPPLLDALVQETDRSIWTRSVCASLESECVPLFWEGAFSLNCLYTDAEIVPLVGASGLSQVIVIEPSVALTDADAHGEGDVPGAYFFDR
jgi:hypothetical protein